VIAGAVNMSKPDTEMIGVMVPREAGSIQAQLVARSSTQPTSEVALIAPVPSMKPPLGTKRPMRLAWKKPLSTVRTTVVPSRGTSKVA
jgi:hypothetical protein